MNNISPKFTTTTAKKIIEDRLSKPELQKKMLESITTNKNIKKVMSKLAKV
ncbi:hypothetical protein [Oenococcus kitaharae]|uniref:Uncharacterized protein n=1 Tax=Oenococcus kitaharae DSM 17330 TaxID=1045004 RepID=G9WIM9_9LACO|nr:hypothetical protein [Oenococcus kitaharae]EHN58168.1 hypothetical protein OKIT_0039 [Oenococcus kitaharae DSM 17330]